MAVLSSALFWQPCDEEDNVQAQITTFHDGGFEGTDEYTPQGADNSEIQRVLPQVRLLRAAHGEEVLDGDNPEWLTEKTQEISGEVKIDRWNAENRSVTVTSEGPGFAVLRLMDYPAWRVMRNGTDVRDRTKRSDGVMVIPVDAGTNHIDVRWCITNDQWAGIGLSLGALAITLALGWKGKRRIDVDGFR
jgi:hypothetical protein